MASASSSGTVGACLAGWAAAVSARVGTALVAGANVLQEVTVSGLGTPAR